MPLRLNFAVPSTWSAVPWGTAVCAYSAIPS
jgi:hypothetical protein